MATIDEILIPSLTFDEVSAPSTPASDAVVLYAKSDGLLYSKDDAGSETLVSGGAGGGGTDRLLGFSSYAAGSDAAMGTATSATQADIDASNAAVTFDGTGWDTVLVRVSVLVQNNTLQKWSYFGLRESTTNVAGPTKVFYMNSGAGVDFVRRSCEFVVGSISDGSHTYKLAGSVDTTSTLTFYTGPTQGRLVMEVWGIA